MYRVNGMIYDISNCRSCARRRRCKLEHGPRRCKTLRDFVCHVKQDLRIVRLITVQSQLYLVLPPQLLKRTCILPVQTHPLRFPTEWGL